MKHYTSVQIARYWFRPKILTLVLILFITSCATSPAQKFHQAALTSGLLESTLATEQFSLISYSKLSPQELASKPVLNVYLDGDGTPWITLNHKSIDPTPRKRTVLDLMLLDQNPSIYIGRPCYHQLRKQGPCDSKWWTSHRYSEEVVNSLRQAVNSIKHPQQLLNIIGFSGGGSLAMLLAATLVNPEGKTSVNSLITINANLDIQHWARQHNYSPLYGSLNPIEQAPLNKAIQQMHFLAEFDKNVDATYLFKKLNGRPATTVRVMPNFNHHCCWSEIWPQFINNLK